MGGYYPQYYTLVEPQPAPEPYHPGPASGGYGGYYVAAPPPRPEDEEEEYSAPPPAVYGDPALASYGMAPASDPGRVDQAAPQPAPAPREYAPYTPYVPMGDPANAAGIPPPDADQNTMANWYYSTFSDEQKQTAVADPAQPPSAGYRERSPASYGYGSGAPPVMPASGFGDAGFGAPAPPVEQPRATDVSQPATPTESVPGGERMTLPTATTVAGDQNADVLERQREAQRWQKADPAGYVMSQGAPPPMPASAMPGVMTPGAATAVGATPVSEPDLAQRAALSQTTQGAMQGGLPPSASMPGRGLGTPPVTAGPQPTPTDMANQFTRQAQPGSEVERARAVMASAPPQPIPGQASVLAARDAMGSVATRGGALKDAGLPAIPQAVERAKGMAAAAQAGWDMMTPDQQKRMVEGMLVAAGQDIEQAPAAAGQTALTGLGAAGQAALQTGAGQMTARLATEIAPGLAAVPGEWGNAYNTYYNLISGTATEGSSTSGGMPNFPAIIGAGLLASFAVQDMPRQGYVDAVGEVLYKVATNQPLEPHEWAILGPAQVSDIMSKSSGADPLVLSTLMSDEMKARIIAWHDQGFQRAAPTTAHPLTGIPMVTGDPGPAFTGGRAVWEGYQDWMSQQVIANGGTEAQASLVRGIRDFPVDPTVMLPFAEAAAAATKAVGGAIRAGSSATKLGNVARTLTGGGLQAVGTAVEAPARALNIAADAPWEVPAMMGRWRGWGSSNSQVKTDVVGEHANEVARAARIVQQAEAGMTPGGAAPGAQQAGGGGGNLGPGGQQQQQPQAAGVAGQQQAGQQAGAGQGQAAGVGGQQQAGQQQQGAGQGQAAGVAGTQQQPQQQAGQGQAAGVAGAQQQVGGQAGAGQGQAAGVGAQQQAGQPQPRPAGQRPGRGLAGAHQSSSEPVRERAAVLEEAIESRQAIIDDPESTRDEVLQADEDVVRAAVDLNRTASQVGDTSPAREEANAVLADVVQDVRARPQPQPQPEPAPATTAAAATALEPAPGLTSTLGRLTEPEPAVGERPSPDGPWGAIDAPAPPPVPEPGPWSAIDQPRSATRAAPGPAPAPEPAPPTGPWSAIDAGARSATPGEPPSARDLPPITREEPAVSTSPGAEATGERPSERAAAGPAFTEDAPPEQGELVVTPRGEGRIISSEPITTQEGRVFTVEEEDGTIGAWRADQLRAAERQETRTIGDLTDEELDVIIRMRGSDDEPPVQGGTRVLDNETVVDSESLDILNREAGRGTVVEPGGRVLTEEESIMVDMALAERERRIAAGGRVPGGPEEPAVATATREDAPVPMERGPETATGGRLVIRSGTMRAEWRPNEDGTPGGKYYVIDNQTNEVVGDPFEGTARGRRDATTAAQRGQRERARILRETVEVVDREAVRQEIIGRGAAPPTEDQLDTMVATRQATLDSRSGYYPDAAAQVNEKAAYPTDDAHKPTGDHPYLFQERGDDRAIWYIVDERTKKPRRIVDRDFEEWHKKLMEMSEDNFLGKQATRWRWAMNSRPMKQGHPFYRSTPVPRSWRGKRAEIGAAAFERWKEMMAVRLQRDPEGVERGMRLPFQGQKITPPVIRQIKEKASLDPDRTYWKPTRQIEELPKGSPDRLRGKIWVVTDEAGNRLSVPMKKTEAEKFAAYWDDYNLAETHGWTPGQELFETLAPPPPGPSSFTIGISPNKVEVPNGSIVEVKTGHRGPSRETTAQIVGKGTGSRVRVQYPTGQTLPDGTREIASDDVAPGWLRPSNVTEDAWRRTHGIDQPGGPLPASARPDPREDALRLLRRMKEKRGREDPRVLTEPRAGELIDTDDRVALVDIEARLSDPDALLTGTVKRHYISDDGRFYDIQFDDGSREIHHADNVRLARHRVVPDPDAPGNFRVVDVDGAVRVSNIADRRRALESASMHDGMSYYDETPDTNPKWEGIRHVERDPLNGRRSGTWEVGNRRHPVVLKVSQPDDVPYEDPRRPYEVRTLSNWKYNVFPVRVKTADGVEVRWAVKERFEQVTGRWGEGGEEAIDRLNDGKYITGDFSDVLRFIERDVRESPGRVLLSDGAYARPGQGVTTINDGKPRVVGRIVSWEQTAGNEAMVRIRTRHGEADFRPDTLRAVDDDEDFTDIRFTAGDVVALRTGDGYVRPVRILDQSPVDGNLHVQHLNPKTLQPLHNEIEWVAPHRALTKDETQVMLQLVGRLRAQGMENVQLRVPVFMKQYDSKTGKALDEEPGGYYERVSGTHPTIALHRDMLENLRLGASVLDHEVVHFLRDWGVITDSEWDALVRLGNEMPIPRGSVRAGDGTHLGQAMDARAQMEMYRPLVDRYGVERVRNEELVGDMYALYRENPSRFGAVAAAILEKAKQFIDALIAALQGSRIDTVDPIKVLEAIADGNMMKRPSPGWQGYYAARGASPYTAADTLVGEVPTGPVPMRLRPDRKIDEASRRIMQAQDPGAYRTLDSGLARATGGQLGEGSLLADITRGRIGKQTQMAAPTDAGRRLGKRVGPDGVILTTETERALQRVFGADNPQNVPKDLRGKTLVDVMEETRDDMFRGQDLANRPALPAPPPPNATRAVKQRYADLVKQDRIDASELNKLIAKHKERGLDSEDAFKALTPDDITDLTIKRATDALIVEMYTRNPSKDILSRAGRAIGGAAAGFDEISAELRDLILHNTLTGGRYVAMNVVGNSLTAGVIGRHPIMTAKALARVPRNFRDLRARGTTPGWAGFAARHAQPTGARNVLNVGAGGQYGTGKGLGLGGGVAQGGKYATGSDTATYTRRLIQRIPSKNGAARDIATFTRNLGSLPAWRDLASAVDLSFREVHFVDTAMRAERYASKPFVNQVVASAQKANLNLGVADIRKALNSAFNDATSGRFAGANGDAIRQALKSLDPGNLGQRQADFDGWVTHESRAWAEVQNNIEKMAQKDMEKYWFTGKSGTMDEALRKLGSFHYWATRWFKLATTESIANPYLGAAFHRLVDGIKQLSDRDDLPPWMSGWIETFEFMGFDILTKPYAAMQAFLMLPDEIFYNPADSRATPLGKAVREFGLMANPLLLGIAWNSGILGDIPKPNWFAVKAQLDAAYLGYRFVQEQSPLGIKIDPNFMRDAGSHLVMSPDEWWTKKTADLRQRAATALGRYIPWGEMGNIRETTMSNRVDRFREEASSMVWDRYQDANWDAQAQSDYDAWVKTLNLPPGSQLPSRQDFIEAMAIDAINNPANKWFGEAEDREFRRQAIEFLPKVGATLGVPATTAPDATLRDTNRNILVEDAKRALDGEYLADPRAQTAWDIDTMIEMTHVDGAKINNINDVYNTIGGEWEKTIAVGFRTIRNGEVVNPITVDGIRFSPEQINAMEFSERAAIADRWLETMGATRLHRDYLRHQEMFLEAHPDLRAKLALDDIANNYVGACDYEDTACRNASADKFIVDTAAANPAFAAHVKGIDEWRAAETAAGKPWSDKLYRDRVLGVGGYLAIEDMGGKAWLPRLPESNRMIAGGQTLTQGVEALQAEREKRATEPWSEPYGAPTADEDVRQFMEIDQFVREWGYPNGIDDIDLYTLYDTNPDLWYAMRDRGWVGRDNKVWNEKFQDWTTIASQMRSLPIQERAYVDYLRANPGSKLTFAQWLASPAYKRWADNYIRPPLDPEDYPPTAAGIGFVPPTIRSNPSAPPTPYDPYRTYVSP